MKKFYCDNCKKYLFEIDDVIYEIPTGTICLCRDCAGLFRMLMDDRPKSTGTSSMPDFMQDFFGGFKK